MKIPPYSAVIVSDRADKRLKSLEAIAKLPAEDRPREILLAVGRNPSRQRNLGLSACKDPLVYFLDDDSEAVPGAPARLRSHFEDGRTAVAGGPNLCHPGASPFEKTVSAVLASWLGSFKVRSRYAATGSVREATEKDLILCNMMVRRETFLAEGGFREDLYPNEENEFLNRLLHSQFRLVYDPRAAIFRDRRKGLGAFCHQAFRYGRGRARQIKVYPCLSDVVHLVPAFFTLYVLSLAALFLPRFQDPCGSFFLLGVSPLFLFSILAFGTGIAAVSWTRRLGDLARVPFLIFLRHFFYGLGLFAGFLTPAPRPNKEPIELFKVRFQGTRYRLVPVGKRKRS